MTKLIGITYPKVGVQYNRRHDDSPTLITNDDDIKANIMTAIFTNNNDAVLLNYNGKLFLCEKLDTTYSKREISYHPLSSLVS